MSDRRLALRLIAGAGWRDHVRSLLTIVGVALAVAAILIGSIGPRVSMAQASVTAAREPVLGELRAGQHQMQATKNTVDVGGRIWTQYWVYGVGPDSPRPAGLAAWPAAGHSVVSPALAQVLASHAAPALGAVEPARLSAAILTSPSELVSYSTTAQPLSEDDGPVKETVVAFGAAQGPTGSVTTVLVELAVLVGIPAILLLSVIFRLAVTARERRTRALHLVGMNPERIARLYANELTVSVAVGYVAGVALQSALLPAAAAGNWLGLDWWPGQVALSPVVLAVVGVLAVVAVRWLCRRVVRRATMFSPVRGSRRPAPRWTAPVAAAAMVAGVAVLAGVLAWLLIDRPDLDGLEGIALAVLGAVAVGLCAVAALGRPLTAAGARLMGRGERVDMFLGMRSAEHRAREVGRLASFVAVAVVLCGLAPGILGSLAWSAEGDLVHSPISVNLDDVDPGHRAQIDRLAARHTVLVEAYLTEGGEPMTVAIGDCATAATAAMAVSDQSITGCHDGSAQRGEFSSATGDHVVLPGLGAIPVDRARIRNATWDVLLPATPANLAWASHQPEGEVTVVASRADGSFAATVADVQALLRPTHVDADVKNPDQYVPYLQQRTLIRAGLSTGLVLALLSLLLSCVELRWAARRTTAMLSALGTRPGVQRRATAASFALPVVVCGVPAWLLGTLGGAGFLIATTAPDALATTNTWLPGAVALGASILIAAATGALVGAGRFTPQALADQ